MEANKEELKINADRHHYRVDPAQIANIPWSYPTQFVGGTDTQFVTQDEVAKKKAENYKKFYARLADAKQYIDREELAPAYVILKDALSYSDSTMPLASEIASTVKTLEASLSIDQITEARRALARK